MKPKSFILFALSAGCGLVAMLGVKQVLSAKKGDAKPAPVMVKVLHAKGDISPHMPLDPALIEFRPMPKNAVPLGAVTKLEEYEGRALRTSAVANEPIMKAKLTDRGAFDASTSIPDGMRLVSVPVNLTTSHSGLIRPTDRVDVICTFEAPGANGNRGVSTTKTILDFIEVFAIDRRTPTDEANRDDILVKNVSLLVTPQQAQLVMLALKEGQLHLALRSKTDEAKAKTVPSDEIKDLWQGSTVLGVRDEELDKLNQEKLALSAKELDELKRQNDELQAALKQLQDQPEKPAAVVVAPPKAKPQWSVVVFSGEEQTKAQFTLEEEKSEDGAGQSGSSGAGEPLSAPKASDAEVSEAQSVTKDVEAVEAKEAEATDTETKAAETKEETTPALTDPV